jgi:beta-N-acetylhexosaminidase
LQGNIRATTAPISLDPQALNSLLAQPELAPWRQAGGIVVSDALGVRSVELFYDDTEQEFPHRQVAKDALLAGNDLLYVADFARGSANETAQLANVKDTIQWFGERYETDPTFRLRADDAVMRILKLKLRLYGGDLSAENVIQEPADDVASPVQPLDSAAFFDIAESAVTLLAPSADELLSRLVRPPGSADSIVIFTDVHEVQSCAECEPAPMLSQTALQERILALYGPLGSGQVQPENVISFSFADLNDFLDAGAGPIPLPTVPITPTVDAETEPANPTPVPTPTLPADYRVQEALREADWLVFALLNSGSRAGAADSDALSRFLALRPDLASSSEVVVLAFDAPYFLDSTEISKLTAYYGVYSKIGAFVDAGVRALFLESPLSGASPVNVEGIQYDLFSQTQPAPDQVIELFLIIGDEIESPSRQEPLASAIGDTLRLQTGVVVDRNGRAVPDGTIVRFFLRNRVQGTVTILGDRATTGGVAQLDYVLDASMGPGQFRITAESGAATLSQEVDITIEDDAQLSIISPTAAPTATITPSPTPTATPPPTETPAPQPPTATPPPAEPPTEPGWLIGLSEMRAFVGVIAGLLIVVGLAWFLNRRLPQLSLAHQVGRLLWGVSGGLLVYNYYALGLPGSGLFAGLGSLAGLILIVAGGVLGLAIYRPARALAKP